MTGIISSFAGLLLSENRPLTEAIFQMLFLFFKTHPQYRKDFHNQQNYPDDPMPY